MKSLLAALLSAVLLTACFHNEAQDELIDYLNKDLKTSDAQYEEISKIYDSVTGDNYTDDQTTYDALTTQIRPKYSKLITAIEDVHPKTPEVRAIHELYIDAMTEQSQAMEQIATAAETQDSSKMDEANQKLANARKKFRDFQNKLTDTAKKLDVEITREQQKA